MGQDGTLRLGRISDVTGLPGDAKIFLFLDDHNEGSGYAYICFKNNDGDKLCVGMGSSGKSMSLSTGVTIDQNLSTSSSVQFDGITISTDLVLGDDDKVQADRVTQIDSGLHLFNTSDEGVDVETDGDIVINLGDSSGSQSFLIKDTSDDKIFEILSNRVTTINDYYTEFVTSDTDATARQYANLQITFPNNGTDTNYMVKVQFVGAKNSSSSVYGGELFYSVMVQSGGATSVTDLTHNVSGITESVTTGTRTITIKVNAGGANMNNASMFVGIISSANSASSITYGTLALAAS